MGLIFLEVHLSLQRTRNQFLGAHCSERMRDGRRRKEEEERREERLEREEGEGERGEGEERGRGRERGKGGEGERGGIVIDELSQEPEYGANKTITPYEGCIYTAEAERDFVKYYLGNPLSLFPFSLSPSLHLTVHLLLCAPPSPSRLCILRYLLY